MTFILACCESGSFFWQKRSSQQWLIELWHIEGDRKLIQEQTRQIICIGNNLNQIAK